MLGFLWVARGDGVGDRAVRSGGFGAVVLGDVLFGGGPADGLLDSGENRCQDGVSACLHKKFVKLVISGTGGGDAAFGDIGERPAANASRARRRL